MSAVKIPPAYINKGQPQQKINITTTLPLDGRETANGKALVTFTTRGNNITSLRANSYPIDATIHKLIKTTNQNRLFKTEVRRKAKVTPI